MPAAQGGLAPRTAFVLLLVLAVLHASLGVVEGLFDGGDYGLVWIATPMMALTGLAAVASLARSRWARQAAIALTSASLALSFALITAYGLGLFHLPQSVLALLVALIGVRR